MSQETSCLVSVKVPCGRCWVDPAASRAWGLHGDAHQLASQVLTIVQAADEGRGVTLKDDRHSRVCRVEAAGRSWVVKRYPHRNKRWKMRAYHALRRTLAWREWRGCRRLTSLGRRTSTPIALVHDTAHPREGLRQHLVMPYLDGRSVDHVLRGETNRELRLQIARAIGRQVGLLSASGWRNADLKPSNLLVDGAVERVGEPVMIDPTSIRVRRTRRAVLDTLAHLLQTSLQQAKVTPREGLTCLAAAAAADASLAPGRTRLATLARKILT